MIEKLQTRLLKGFKSILKSTPVLASSLTWAASPALSPKVELSEIDRALAESEAQYTDIVANTEKSVRWYAQQQKTQIALVYIHGFSATARELTPVTENPADQLQANVYYARLAGHGRSGDAMVEASREKWFADVREAFTIGQMIGDKVVVISTSTGGTLALWLAAQDFAKDIAANILVSPNFGIGSRSGEILRWDWGLQLAKWVSGDYRGFEPQNDLHRRYWTERYPIEALVPMIKLVDDVLEMDKSTIRSPHLMLYSPNDQVIRVDRILEVSETLNNADVTLSPFTDSEDPAQHVLAGDACSPSTTDEVVAIMRNYLDTIPGLQ